MARKNFRRSGSGGTAHWEGMGYNTRTYGNQAEFYIFGRKTQKTRNGHGEAVTMVP